MQDPTSRWWPKPNLVARKLSARRPALCLSKFGFLFTSSAFPTCADASAALWQDPVAYDS